MAIRLYLGDLESELRATHASEISLKAQQCLGGEIEISNPVRDFGTVLHALLMTIQRSVERPDLEDGADEALQRLIELFALQEVREMAAIS